MSKTILVLLVNVFLLSIIALPAWAELGYCSAYSTVKNSLAQKYGEVRQGIGLMVRGEIAVELLVNPETGTWTLLKLKPNGTACLILVGTDFRILKQGKPL